MSTPLDPIAERLANIRKVVAGGSTSGLRRDSIFFLLDLISDLQDEIKVWREADRIANEGVEENEPDSFAALGAKVFHEI